MPFFGPRDNQYDPADIPLPANFDSPPTEQNHIKSRYRHMEQKKGLKFETWVNDPKSMRQLIARYWGLCSQVDTHCGTILDTLKECGLWDDTIIVFTSDHGDMMGSHQLIEKGVMYEESVRVPLLVKLPGQREMRRIKGLVSQLDLVPTLLDMMEAEAPEHLEGTSRLETLSSAVGRIEDDVVIEWNMDKANPQEPRIVDEDSEFNYENVKAALQDPVRTIISGDGRWKLNVSPQLEQHELYDLQSDPYERENIFGRDDTRQITGELVERLRAWQRQTEDTVEIPDI